MAVWEAYGYWDTRQTKGSHGQYMNPGQFEDTDARFRTLTFDDATCGNAESAAEQQALYWLEIDGAQSVTFYKKEV